jgi:dTMP kinase
MTTSVPRGLFITFEGIDRCGKSTQAALLCAALVAAGAQVGYAGAPGSVLREPGGTAAGERIRDILLNGTRVDPRTEALLYAAARAQLVEQVVRPSLAVGYTVILDRYVDSSLAYQGYARGLGIDRVAELNLWATDGLLPDITFLLELTPELAAARVPSGAHVDRIEGEGIAFQRLVAEGYARVADLAPARVQVVAGDRPAEQIAADIAALATARFEARHV